jgi:hypothetical protein
VLFAKSSEKSADEVSAATAAGMPRSEINLLKLLFGEPCRFLFEFLRCQFLRAGVEVESFSC